jgi:hypothetical protein
LTALVGLTRSKNVEAVNAGDSPRPVHEFGTSSGAFPDKHSKAYAAHPLLIVLRALRPAQWLKNGLVFAGLVFGGRLFRSTAIASAIFAAMRSVS